MTSEAGWNVERDKDNEYLSRMRQFLQEKLESEGHVWRGHYVQESR